MRFLIPIVLGAFLLISSCSEDEEANNTDARELKDENAVAVILDTSVGEIIIELDSLRAPVSVDNFLQYVDAGFYEGTIFHRVIPNFMVQGGGYQKGLKRPKGLREPIRNEAKNKVSNKRGTVAMARSSQIDSATSQFFINLVDNPRLDNRGDAPSKYGYAVFGKVIKGLELIDQMAAAETLCPSTQKSGRCNRKLPAGMRDVPVEEIVINSIARHTN